jgi:hypothetical protein
MNERRPMKSMQTVVHNPNLKKKKTIPRDIAMPRRNFRKMAAVELPHQSHEAAAEYSVDRTADILTFIALTSLHCLTSSLCNTV